MHALLPVVCRFFAYLSSCAVPFSQLCESKSKQMIKSDTGDVQEEDYPFFANVTYSTLHDLHVLPPSLHTLLLYQ